MALNCEVLCKEVKTLSRINFVDAAPSKQRKFLPGSHIPVYDESKIRECRPDFIIILPWNLKEKIMEQLSYASEWGCQFVVFIPELQKFDSKFFNKDNELNFIFAKILI